MPPFREPVKELPEITTEDRVEADRRLVEHEQFGLGQESRREGDARALAAGEPVHETLAKRFHRHFRQHAVDRRLGLGQNAREQD